MAAYSSDTNEPVPGAAPGRRARRKWRRTAHERRAAAAASLADLFHPPRVRHGTMITLAAVSLAGHMAFVAVVSLTGGGQGDILREAAEKDSYLRKVLEKDRARFVASNMASKFTPPPPPDPESVVNNALSQSLVSDVAKLTDNLLEDVKLKQDLAGYIKKSLKDELDAASKDIAKGRLSEKEIEELHRKFQKQAHDATLSWRKDYLEKHQVERATMNTTQWYEKDIAATLVNNMRREMFYIPHGGSVWCRFFRWDGSESISAEWGFLNIKGFNRRTEVLGNLLQGACYDSQGRFGGKKLAHGLSQLPDWPEPSPMQAQAVALALKDARGTDAAWNSAIQQVLDDYYPHKPKEGQQIREKLNSLWTAALEAADKYENEGGDTAALKAAQSACLDATKNLCQAMAPILPKEREYAVINQAVRSRVLRGQRDKMYDFFLQKMVEGLTPMIKDLARGQFEEGILVHKDGVEQAINEFPTTIVPLLRRDLERMYAREDFCRRVFEMPYMNPYRSKVTREDGPPDEADIKADEEAMAQATSRNPEMAAYAEKRSEVLGRQFQFSVTNVKEELLRRFLSGGRIFRGMDKFLEGVDYADKVGEKLDSRAMALSGRGQDLAKLTDTGVPDTSAPLVALMFGAGRGAGVNLEPVSTGMQPGYVTEGLFGALLAPAQPVLPPLPAKWGFEQQQELKPSFQTPRYEAIPFLPQFPRLDGDLADWGRIRPLILQAGKGGGDQIIVYAAWNYQGFFFGYQVRQPAEFFYYPSQFHVGGAHDYYAVTTTRIGGVDWAFKGDYFRLMFDTLDARQKTRGQPHTQEFVVFPRGTDSTPEAPGIEKVISSQRDAQTKQWRGIKACCKTFSIQPAPQVGPDGTGPYRITRVLAGNDPARQGYSTEVFMPRSLFNVPVFCPGWHIGFDCTVAAGAQGSFNGKCQYWAGNNGDAPVAWGDLLMLGTDPRIIIQEADASATVATGIVPGHSYLLTVVDPDRNVNLAYRDSVLVSAEVMGGNNDAEVFVLQETSENSSVFRGYINTQPGPGREAPGALEVMPLQMVRFGYVDIADSKGRRNVVFETKLPVVTPVAVIAAAK